MKVLVIAPHPDDEVLGCGGTIAKRVCAGDDVFVLIVTEGALPLYSKSFVKKEREEARVAHATLGCHPAAYLSFPSAMLDSVNRYQLNDAIAKIVNEIQPEEVYVPYGNDMHLDHQIVFQASMVALRPKGKHVVERVYAYETLSETDWNAPELAFKPDVYEDISCFITRKLEALHAYKSQCGRFPNPRSLEAVAALAKHRGCLAGFHAAEAFQLIREVKP